MKIQIEHRNLGVNFDQQGRAQVVVWAPEKKSVSVELTEQNENIALDPQGRGYWSTNTDKIEPGDLYRIRLDGKDSFPDPASVQQPHGVHGPSQAYRQDNYQWNDPDWKNPQLQDYLIYELHTGTFTHEGTFAGIIKKLDHLKELGINAIEIMPVAQFPGNRNWGYDGVNLFAPHFDYGAANGLKELVDQCHQHGIAVILDVVYNHLGPEGNYLGQFGPYFTGKYNTPWGKALNFDDNWSDGVRHFFLENALMWFRDFHVDALRLDAVHAIKDGGVQHFLAELREKTDELSHHTGRSHYFIAECDLNDPKYIHKPDNCGYGMHSQWVDEFHHALRVSSGQERSGYYSEFNGIEHLAKSYQDAYVFDGVYSEHRKRTFGGKTDGLPGDKFVVFSQNHDQTGNRMLGERTSQLVSFEMQKLLAGAVLVSPFIPMLFMGEEWSASTPFLYFVSHTDPNLVEAVRKGRRAEFRDFHKKGTAPDPQSEQTFEKSTLNWKELQQEKAATMLRYYQNLIQLRKDHEALSAGGRENINAHAHVEIQTLELSRSTRNEKALCLLNFSPDPQKWELPQENVSWKLLLNSAHQEWGGQQEPDSSVKETVTLPAESITIFHTYV